MALTGSWVTVDDVIGDDALCPSCVGVEAITDDVAEAAARLASSVLYEMTGRRWPGVSERVVRPAARRRMVGPPPDPRVLRDAIYVEVPPDWSESWGWYDSDDPNDIAGKRQIMLGFYPVRSIVEVRIDGQVVDPNTYRVDEGKWLVRTDGGLWPCRQNWWRDDDEPGTWSVRFMYGVDAPDEARTIAALYACELAKGMCGMECQLPARTQSISRQGVSQVLFDPLDLIADGMVGIPIVDTWVKSVNPNRRRRRARIVSADVPRRVRYG